MNEDAEVIARKAGMKGWGIFMLVLGSLCAVFLIVAEVLKMQGDEDYPAVFLPRSTLFRRSRCLR